MSIDLEALYNAILGNLGTLVILLTIMYGGFKRWWVFGWYATELSLRIKDLEQRLDRRTGQTDNATALASKVVDLAEKRTE